MSILTRIRVAALSALLTNLQRRFGFGNEGYGSTLQFKAHPSLVNRIVLHILHRRKHGAEELERRQNDRRLPVVEHLRVQLFQVLIRGAYVAFLPIPYSWATDPCPD